MKLSSQDKMINPSRRYIWVSPKFLNHEMKNFLDQAFLSSPNLPTKDQKLEVINHVSLSRTSLLYTFMCWTPIQKHGDSILFRIEMHGHNLIITDEVLKEGNIDIVQDLLEKMKLEVTLDLDFNRSKVKPIFGFLITKEGIWMEADKPIKINHMKPQIYRSKKDITNNQAEYMALKKLVEWLPPKSICKVYSDSMLVVCQIGGTVNGKECHWRCHNLDLRNLKMEVLKIMREKELTVGLRWLPREINRYGIILDKVKNADKKEKRNPFHIQKRKRVRK